MFPSYRFYLAHSRRLGICVLSLVIGVSMGLSLLALLGRPPHAAQAAPASDIVVNPGESIQAAINSAVNGDTIIIMPGMYTESLTLNKPVNLVGTTADSTIIKAVSSQRVLTVTGVAITHSTIISGLTFTGGAMTGGFSCFSNGCGGAILVAGSAQPLIQNMIITNNVANFEGGGIYAEANSPLTLINVSVLSNATAIAGGGVFVFGPLAITGGLFQGNSSISYGGLYAGNGLALTDTKFISNTSQANSAGGAYVHGPVTLNGGLFQGNSANGFGGGLYADNTLRLSGTQFLSNTAFVHGGGLYVLGGATLTQGVFQDNRCTGISCQGGGLYAMSGLNLTGTQFMGNSSESAGGGAWVSDTLTMTSAQFISNAVVSGDGGGLYVRGGSNSLIQTSLFQNNVAGDEGGGLLIEAANTFTLSANRILDNQAGVDGGGMYFSATVFAYLDNNLIAANTVLTDIGAAEISLTASGTTVIGRHNTFASATPGSGLALKAGETMVLTNTIFDGYALGVRTELLTPTIMLDSVLWSNITTPTLGNGIVVTNSITGNAAFKNPAGRDYHLLDISNAIDVGVDAGLTIDFEGEARPQEAGFDLGFDEYVVYWLFLPLIQR